MTDSKTLQTYLELLNEKEIPTNPERHFGPNWRKVLAFWRMIDTFSLSRKMGLNAQWACEGTWEISRDLRDLAKGIVGEDSAVAAWNATDSGVFSIATMELICDVDNKKWYSFCVQSNDYFLTKMEMLEMISALPENAVITVSNDCVENGVSYSQPRFTESSDSRIFIIGDDQIGDLPFEFP
jgi:hypothetical protein